MRCLHGRCYVPLTPAAMGASYHAAAHRLEAEGLGVYINSVRAHAWCRAPGGEAMEAVVAWAREQALEQAACEARRRQLAECLRANGLAHLEGHEDCEGFVASPLLGEDAGTVTMGLLDQLAGANARMAELMGRRVPAGWRACGQGGGWKRGAEDARLPPLPWRAGWRRRASTPAPCSAAAWRSST